jgi:ActR/RegA family two-component response regulator
LVCLGSCQRTSEGGLGQSPPRRRVLVVEDEYLIASYLTADLDELGFAVIGPARNLADARALASTSALDCARIDIALGAQSALPAQILPIDIPFRVYDRGQREP